jgi:hypothetical protein
MIDIGPSFLLVTFHNRQVRHAVWVAVRPEASTAQSREGQVGADDPDLGIPRPPGAIGTVFKAVFLSGLLAFAAAPANV